jgi:hypothetical protein
MVPAALVLVVIGSVSLVVLVTALVQSTSSGAVQVAAFGTDLVRISPLVAIVAGVAIGLGLGLGILGVTLLLRHRAEARAGRSATEQARMAQTEIEARARLLDYRIRLLSDHVNRLEARRAVLERDEERTDLPPEGSPQPGRTSGHARVRLVLLPEVDESTANGHHSEP